MKSLLLIPWFRVARKEFDLLRRGAGYAQKAANCKGSHVFQWELKEDRPGTIVKSGGDINKVNYDMLRRLRDAWATLGF